MQKDLQRTFSILLIICGVINLAFFILSMIIFLMDGSPGNIPLLKIMSQNSGGFGIAQISFGIIGIGIAKDVNALHSKALYRLSVLFSLILIFAYLGKFASLESTNTLNPIYIAFNIITFLITIVFGISFKTARK